MSIAGLNTREPRLDIRPVGGVRPDTSGGLLLRERLISFELEETLKLVDVARLEFDNSDGKLFSKESIALGVQFVVSFGYVEEQTPPRVLQVRKVSGFSGVRAGAGAPVGP